MYSPGEYDAIQSYMTKPTITRYGHIIQKYYNLNFDYSQCVECNQNTIFWHELGHFINPDNPSEAIRNENIYRQRYNLELRPFDIEHLIKSNK